MSANPKLQIVPRSPDSEPNGPKPATMTEIIDRKARAAIAKRT